MLQPPFKIIDEQYLMKNPSHVFVFGDNLARRGTGGAARLRHLTGSVYGFITKKAPTHTLTDYYKPEEYKTVFEEELTKLDQLITNNPNRKYLISRIGAQLANKYNIFETVILPGLKKWKLEKNYKNVEFLWDIDNDQAKQ